MRGSLLNQEKVSLRKRYNRSLILSALWEWGSLSRTKLRELTGIRMATITSLVKGLIAEGLLVERGKGSSTKGRKQTLLDINHCGGFIIGVELEPEFLSVVAVDLKPNVVGEVRIEINPESGKDKILKAIVEAVKRILKESSLKREKIIGLGFADPGLVNSREGISIFASNVKGWRNVPVKKILEDEFSFPVFMEAGSQAMVLGERWFGVGKGVDDMIFINLCREGVGAGIIGKGVLYQGFSQGAGEIGHTHVVESDTICNCGSYGCLDAIASTWALVKGVANAIEEGARSLVTELAKGKLEELNPEIVFEAARRGDKLSLTMINRIADYLGLAIANVVNLFNPQLIILGGKFVQVGDLLVEPVKRIVQTQALQDLTKNLRFELSHLGDKAGALGATTLVLERIFNLPQLEWPEKLRRKRVEAGAP